MSNYLFMLAVLLAVVIIMIISLLFLILFSKDLYGIQKTRLIKWRKKTFFNGYIKGMTATYIKTSVAFIVLF